MILTWFYCKNPSREVAVAQTLLALCQKTSALEIPVLKQVKAEYAKLQ